MTGKRIRPLVSVDKLVLRQSPKLKCQTSTGALATLSGAKTGRSPKDKRVVKDETTASELWWGK